MATTHVPVYCTLCRSRCGTLNTVDGERLLRVDPDPSHPTGRAMGSKGRAAPEIAFSSRRLLTPKRRTRPKTDPDPGWVDIGWDEAMAEVAARLAAQRDAGGAESVAFAAASPISDAIDWIERFFRLFGSPNCCYSTEICNWHKDHAHAFTYGMGIGTPEYAKADLILLWGHNPSSVWVSQAGAVAEGQRAGAKLMVVDPRRTAHAGQADHWLRVRPGTDGTLALGLIRQLIATDGGVGQHSDATQTDRAIAVLTALTGTFDAPGSIRDYLRQPANKVNGFDLIDPAQAAKALGLSERPLGPPSQGWITTASLYDAILDGAPYAVRAMVSFGANMVVTHAVAGAARFRARLDASLDPNVVVADYG